MRASEFLIEYVTLDQEKLSSRLDGEDVPEGLYDPAKFLAWLEQFDPSPKKKYVNWMGQRYVNGGIHQLEDFASGVVQALARFDKLKNKKKLGADADINKLNGLNQLDALVQKFKGVDTEAKYGPEEVEVLLNTNDWSVTIPLTYKASKHLSQNTTWCTAYPISYQEYSKQGPLYIIHDKQHNLKYQFHFETKSFMNLRDEPIGNENEFDWTIDDDQDEGGFCDPPNVEEDHDAFTIWGLIQFLEQDAFKPVTDILIKAGKVKPSSDHPGAWMIGGEMYSSDGR